MDKIYDRQIDTVRLARDLDNKIDAIFGGLEADLVLTKKISWKKVFKLLDLDFDFMTDKSKEILLNRRFVVKNNPFRSNTQVSYASDRIEVVYPTFFARDSYRDELLRILGDSISLTRKEDLENGCLLGFLYQYLFFKENYSNFDQLFEDKNLKEMILTAKRHLLFLEYYFTNRELYTKEDYRENLFYNVRVLSSFDAALCYIENMSSQELKKFVKMLGENAEKVDEIVKSDKIDTYDYPRLRKLFDNKVKRIGDQ